jgi:Fe-S-cluster containining protein
MSDYPPPRRLSVPDAELAQPWLKALLDAYHEIDRGVHEAVQREDRQGRHLACVRGCAACCRSHLDIPVYPLELMGLYWHCIERTQGPLRERLRVRLADYVAGDPCPFLVDEACGVHPMRPMACRQFNVLDRACVEGEDAFHTRRGDVVAPIRRFADAAFERLLPFYGIGNKAERRQALRDGRVHALARPLQSLDWRALASRMDREREAPS